MDSHLPIIVIELVLTFGGVLLFGWWQLRSIKRDQEAAAARKLAEAQAPAESAHGADRADATGATGAASRTVGE